MIFLRNKGLVMFTLRQITRANRQARIARGRLHENFIKNARAFNLAVHRTVERHSAGQAQIGQRKVFPRLFQYPDNHVFKTLLQGGGNIFMMLFQRHPFFPMRSKHFNKPVADPFVTHVIIAHPVLIDGNIIFAIILNNVFEVGIIGLLLSRNNCVMIAVTRQRHNNPFMMNIFPS